MLTWKLVVRVTISCNIVCRHFCTSGTFLCSLSAAGEVGGGEGRGRGGKREKGGQREEGEEGEEEGEEEREGRGRIEEGRRGRRINTLRCSHIYKSK